MSPSIENTPSVISSCRRPSALLSSEQRVGVVGVLVLEHLDLGAREPRAVDDRRVVQPVAHDHVLLVEDRGDGARRSP